jgi:hypothetical protein
LFRLGFQAALHPRTRGKEYDEVLSQIAGDVEELQKRCRDSEVEEPFRRGYQRGRAYYESLCRKTSR